MSAYHRRVLVVFVDALGPSQLERSGAAFDFLPYRRALSGVLGYSSGALPTLLTGTEPEVHGRMCLFSRRLAGARGVLGPLSLLGLLPRIVHERRIVRRALEKGLAWAHGLTGYLALHKVPPSAFAWLDVPEREDLFHAERIGAASTFLTDARRAGLSVYAADFRLPEAERWARAEAEITRRKPDLTFLYATSLDGQLHAHGHRPWVYEEVMSALAPRVARAREALGGDGAALSTWLVGDHGMADVDAVIDPRPLLRATYATYATFATKVFVDSTMIRLWGGERALSHARRVLSTSGTPGIWLDEEALRARRAPMEGRPYAEAIWLLPEGLMFAPSFLGGRARGMHGYDLGAPSSFAALASDDEGALGAEALSSVAGMIRARLGLADR